MSLQINVLRVIAITSIVFLCILFLPILIPVSDGLSLLFTEFLRFPIPSLLFLTILFLLFIGIGSLTTFKNAGWIPFTLFIQELYFIGVVFTDVIIDSLHLGFLVGFLCIIFLECSSRLTIISSMAEVIPLYQENTDKINNYINKISARFLNVDGKLNAGRKRYENPPSIDYIAIAFFAITLSSFLFFSIYIYNIAERRYPYLIIGILLPIITLSLLLQKVKRG